MTDQKIVPFRGRTPREAELEVYERITRKWQASVRRLIFPEHSKAHRSAGRGPQ